MVNMEEINKPILNLSRIKEVNIFHYIIVNGEEHGQYARDCIYNILSICRESYLYIDFPSFGIDDPIYRLINGIDDSMVG